MLGTYKSCLRDIMMHTIVKHSRYRRLIQNDFNDAFKKVDCILTPISPTTAFKFGEKMDDPLQMYLNDIYTVSANLAGIPGISVPAGVDVRDYRLAFSCWVNNLMKRRY